MGRPSVEVDAQLDELDDARQGPRAKVIDALHNFPPPTTRNQTPAVISAVWKAWQRHYAELRELDRRIRAAVDLDELDELDAAVDATRDAIEHAHSRGMAAIEAGLAVPTPL